MGEVFVGPEWISEDRDETTVVDVRHGWAYREGHVPGAVNVPFDEFRDPTGEAPGKLPTSQGFASVLRESGIAPADDVVAYDGEFGVYASRFVVTAEVYGHPRERLRLLDGDFRAWRRDHPVSTAIPAIEPTTWRCERTGDDPLVGPEQLEAALGTDAVVVDTRDPLEYETVHVPGAVNFQWRDLVDEGTRRLESPARCREILAARGITADRPVRLYCNTARRLSFVYAVLRELGYEDVAFYEGGIAAWAECGGPVETTT